MERRYDNNPYRLSNQVDNAVTLGTASRSDTIDRLNIGASADFERSLQRFTLQGDVDKYLYGQFSNLNHNNINAQSDWLWQFGRAWSGTVGYLWNKQQVGFDQSRGLQPDNRLRRQAHFEIKTLPTSNLQLRLSVNHTEERHSLVSMEIYNRNTLHTAAEVRFQTPLGNAVGVQTLLSDSDLINPQLISNTAVNNSYTTRGLLAFYVGQWTAASQVRLEGGYKNVKQVQLKERDFSGWTTRGGYRWSSAITAVTVEAWRDLDLLSTQAASYMLAKGIKVVPVWTITAKTSAEATLSRSWRTWAGAPPSTTEYSRDDTLNKMKLALNYVPYDKVDTRIGLETGRQISNISSVDYNYRVVSLQVSVRY